jgi:5-methylcytosine-specific restriction endonuclease McrA
MTQDVGTTPRGRLTSRDRRQIWEREAGHCMVCHCKLQTGRFIFEHVRALELGGADHPDNIRLTCLSCAKEKTRDDHSRAAKAKRQKSAALGLKAPSPTPLPCGKRSPFKRKLDGTVVRRHP